MDALGDVSDCSSFHSISSSFLNVTTDNVQQARLLTSRSDGSVDWLHAMPLQCVGLKIYNSTVHITVGICLEAAIVRLQLNCVCGSNGAADGQHGMS